LVSLEKKTKMGWDITLKDWLQDRAQVLPSRIQGLKVLDLMCHTSGLRPWHHFFAECETGKPKPQNTAKERLLEHLQYVGFGSNKKRNYSDIGFIVLGLALELFQKKPLDQLFLEFCQSDLGVEPELFFRPSVDQQKFCVPTGFCNLRKQELSGVVHDENCGALGGVCGHAGLFGSGEGVITYLRALMAHPVGQRILHKNTPTQYSCDGGWGWQRSKDYGCSFQSGQAVGHLGFTGTCFWLGEKNLEYGVLLTNRVVSGRQVQPWMKKMRIEVFESFTQILA